MYDAASAASKLVCACSVCMQCVCVREMGTECVRSILDEELRARIFNAPLPSLPPPPCSRRVCRPTVGRPRV